MTSKPTANTSPSAEEIESYLPAYDRVELIATGGMGAVYRARQISLDRTVAIKVLTHACSSSLQFRQIFKCEAQVMAKLNHPNLVSIYDYGEAHGLLYIVMQFVQGRSLHDAAHGKSVEAHEAAALISTVSKALADAHNSGILHRDIKPANILVDSKINPVVVDFGLAHQSDESTKKGETVFGTPGYTAPEVITPPFSADQRADIFSLGVLLHELLTGQLPQSPYLPPSSLVTVDPRYDSIVMRAIHPSPSMRYHKAEDLAADLDKVLAGQMLSPTPLLHTPVNHPQMVRRVPSSPIVAVAPTPPPKVKPINEEEPPANESPKLDHSRETSWSTKLALAACLAIAFLVTGLVISHTQVDSGPATSRMTQPSSQPKQSVLENDENRAEPTIGPGITANSL
ncbi:serine/threonine protein kinase [Verrucomicrobiaceae bacterium R5-34]|nr:serine/threonine protein kinase [Verrucomicrobiaceae bacterium R5-34]